MDIFKEIVQYIRALYNQPKDPIPLHAPVFIGNEKKYLAECIDTTYVSSVGRFVDQFEVAMANYTGAKGAVACVNGTSALHLALKIIGVKKNNEVITQPLTFIATCNAISYMGSNPVFIDVDMDTLGMSPDSLHRFLKLNTLQRYNYSTAAFECINKASGKIISACLPMHTFGHPCQIDKIVEICDEFHLAVIEDAAEGIGSFYKGQHTGTFGSIGVLSFNGNKIITTGGGGMLLFKDENLARHAKHLSTQAKMPDPWEFRHDEVGYNYRMPNINAALGLAQLEQIDKFIASKRHIAKQYSHFFDSCDLKFVKEPQNAKSNYWLNCILFNDFNERDRFLKYSNENGVMTRPAWRLMNKLDMFNECQTDELINVNYIADRLVNIPSSVRIFKNDMCNKAKRILEYAKN